MKKSFLLPVLIILSIIIGCKKETNNSSQSTATEVCQSKSGLNSMTHNGIDREYVLYIPDSYDGSSSVPVLLNFHGYGGNAEKYMNDADMRSLSETHTFILVYPQGSDDLEGHSHWNPCLTGGDNKSNTDDFGFVEAMFNEISSICQVDESRIYAVGYSNGGMMAYGLANFKSELIAAVGSVSGTMLDCIGTTRHPMPVIHLHGTNDKVIPYDGNSNINIMSVEQVLDHWITFNGTNKNAVMNSTVSGGKTIEHFVYGQGDKNVSVEHYKYHEGDHIWFKTTFEAQTTADLIWNFMSKYDINGMR